MGPVAHPRPRPALRLLLLLAVVVGCESGPVSSTAGPTTTSQPTTTATTPTTTTTTPAGSAPGHLIAVREGEDEFYDLRSGEPFVVRGVNYTIRAPVGRGTENRVFAVSVWDPARFDADLALLARHGYNTVRLWIDSCSDGPSCLTFTGGSGLNPAYLDNLAEGMEIAKRNGIFLLFTSNDIPDGGGYGAEANAGAGPHFSGYRNAHFLTAPGVDAASRYWSDILTGLRQRNAPTEVVLAWSLLNEMWVFEDQPPLSLRSGTVTAANGSTYDVSSEEERRRLVSEGFTHYIATVGETIRRHDPQSLITVGFFHPKFPHPSRLGDSWYVDTASLLHRAQVDFFDFHAYPGVELTIEQYAENFGLVDYEEKPVIMGEVGAFTFVYESPETALPALARFMADSCRHGWDGWLYWEFYQPPEVGDATFGLVDSDGLLLEALSPAHHPDPCDASALAPSDLAHGRPATASASLPAEPAANAVDGSTETIWGAGAHPPQWIEIKLEAVSTVAGVRLLTSQFPAGPTRHRVYGRVVGGSLVLLGELAGQTGDQEWLTLDGTWEGLEAVRVETIESPSWVGWREIQILRG